MAGLTAIDRPALVSFRDRARAAPGLNLLERRLFGSKARGDASADADLDVLVVVAENRVVTRAIMNDPVWRLTGLLRAIEREGIPLRRRKRQRFRNTGWRGRKTCCATPTCSTRVGRPRAP